MVARRRAVTVFAALLSFGTAVTGIAEVALGASLSIEYLHRCYGDAIRVRLEHTGALLDVPVDLRAHLSPPSRLTRNADSKTYSTWPASCHPEPVPVEDLYVYRNHLMTPQIGITDEALTVRRFMLQPGSLSTYAANKPRIEAALARGAAVSEAAGLLRLEPQFPNGGGLYLAENYLVPTGEPFAISCTGGSQLPSECSVLYGFGNGVRIDYWFEPVHVPMERWLELDRLMRRVAEDMFVPAADSHN